MPTARSGLLDPQQNGALLQSTEDSQGQLVSPLQRLQKSRDGTDLVTCRGDLVAYAACVPLAFLSPVAVVVVVALVAVYYAFDRMPGPIEEAGSPGEGDRVPAENAIHPPGGAPR